MGHLTQCTIFINAQFMAGPMLPACGSVFPGLPFTVARPVVGVVLQMTLGDSVPFVARALDCRVAWQQASNCGCVCFVVGSPLSLGALRVEGGVCLVCVLKIECSIWLHLYLKEIIHERLAICAHMFLRAFCPACCVATSSS